MELQLVLTPKTKPPNVSEVTEKKALALNSRDSKGIFKFAF